MRLPIKMIYSISLNHMTTYKQFHEKKTVTKFVDPTVYSRFFHGIVSLPSVMESQSKYWFSTQHHGGLRYFEIHVYSVVLFAT